MQVTAAGIDDSREIPWLAMELLDGEDLQAHRRSERYSTQNNATILRQLFEAMSAAHRTGVVHPDLFLWMTFLIPFCEAGFLVTRTLFYETVLTSRGSISLPLPVGSS